MWSIRLIVLTSQAELAQKILESEFSAQEYDEANIENFENDIE
jgi:hypothetical protein